MKIEDFVQRIRFKSIQPGNPVELPVFEETTNYKIPNLHNVKLEISNTTLPERDGHLKQILYELCLIPRMSTFAIGSIINQAVYLMQKEHAYVNVGVWHGFTLLSGMVNNSNKICIGIDNFSEFYAPQAQFLTRFNQYKSSCHFFYELGYEEYFKKIHQGLIGVYMYDGSHSYENQLRGLQLAEPFFSNNCLIIVDDANWAEPRQATFDFINNSSYEYQIVLDKQTASTMNPTFWNGLIILQREG
ncbi:MAG: class I SAM-dependent methyltransferase [Firmicutes bacterium]|nr:class I SAM-dependent methyltransferase [Bacillota bacterium]